MLDIKQFRLEHNLTQKQFAEMCGLNQHLISEYENGKVKKSKFEHKIDEAISLYLLTQPEPEQELTFADLGLCEKTDLTTYLWLTVAALLAFACILVVM